MGMSPFQWSVAVLVPVFVCLGVWALCRRPMSPGWMGLALVLGAAVTIPIIRLSGMVEPLVGNPAGHFYADELIRQLLTTALPEEWGKGLVAVLVWRLMGKPSNPLAWLCCAAGAHCGFAALEGLLGALGNEGMLKVVVGRSVGATLHCSWGIIFAWFAWRGCSGGRIRPSSWIFALLFPSVLHAIGNAATMEIPGAVADTISGTELMVVLPGMASVVISWALAGWCVYAARNVPIMPPIPPVQ